MTRDRDGRAPRRRPRRRARRARRGAVSAAAAAARLETLEEKLPETVRSISQEALDASRDAFLAQAGERVEKTLLPVHQRLGDLRRARRRVRGTRRVEDGGRLTPQLELLSAGARSIAVALGNTQSRGRWGEIQLERILEFVGMEEGVDYSCQASRQWRSRPDVVVHLPGGKNVVIDSKAPFDAFERAARGDRRRGARRGARRVRAEGPRARRTKLGRKGYWAHVDAVARLHVHVPPRRRVPRRAPRSRTRSSFELRVRRAASSWPRRRTIVVMLRTIRVAWQNENASRQRAGSARGRVGAARAAEHDGGRTSRRSAAGSTRPSARTTRLSARTSVARARLRRGGSKGSARPGSTLEDLPPLTEHAVAAAPAAPARGRAQERRRRRRMSAGTPARRRSFQHSRGVLSSRLEEHCRALV